MSNSRASEILHRPTAPLVNLRRRATLYRELRDYFDNSGFVEVTTPIASRDVAVDRFVESIPVKFALCWSERDDFARRRFSDEETSRRMATTFYLQTSPEFAMKRLVAAGMNAVYQITSAFRSGDRGALHNVEFTILEWYREGDDYRAGRRRTLDLINNVSEKFYATTDVPRQPWSFGVAKERPFGVVFFERTGVDPHACTLEELRRYADKSQIARPESYDKATGGATKDDWLDLIFSESVQPSLGRDAPILLYDYPASQSQLARTGVENGRDVARRFELFIDGLELANGYDELLNADVLRRRVARISEQRRLDGSPELPQESRLLAAMDSGLPPCSGCAMGVDRFLCALLGTKKIDDVISFPTELA